MSYATGHCFGSARDVTRNVVRHKPKDSQMMNHRKDTIIRAVERCLDNLDQIESKVESRATGVSIRACFTDPKGERPPMAHAVASVRLSVFASARADEVIRNGDVLEPVLAR